MIYSYDSKIKFKFPTTITTSVVSEIVPSSSSLTSSLWLSLSLLWGFLCFLVFLFFYSFSFMMYTGSGVIWSLKERRFSSWKAFFLSYSELSSLPELLLESLLSLESAFITSLLFYINFFWFFSPVVSVPFFSRFLPNDWKAKGSGEVLDGKWRSVFYYPARVSFKLISQSSPSPVVLLGCIRPLFAYAFLIAIFCLNFFLSRLLQEALSLFVPMFVTMVGLKEKEFPTVA